MAKIGFEPRTIPRLTFNVSEQCPIVINEWLHRQPYDFASDMHYELELGVVISGQMERVYDGFDAVCHSGDVWMCGVWEPHRYRVVKAPCRVLVMVIRPQALVGLNFSESPGYNWLLPFATHPNKRPRVTPAMCKDVLAWAQRILSAEKLASPQRELNRRVMLLEFLLMLTRDWRPNVQADQKMTYHGQVNRAVQLVFSNPRGITVADTARQCGFSRNTFSRVFKDLMGISFADFALRFRLNGAARQLLGSSDGLKQVANEWGFTDASHLNRSFVLHYGCTPGAYRRQHSALEGN
jgi:AraC-like DNA-binding protein